MSKIKDMIRTTLRRQGLDIVSFNKVNHFDQLNVDVLLDVGANVGQYATKTRLTGYEGHIVSFEPQSTAYARLSAAAAKDGNWTVHDQAAVGAERGTATINISKNSYSSSILPMLDSHAEAAPSSAYVDSEEVQVITLSDVFDQYKSKTNNTFLKIDTQGFERAVLDGCGDHVKELVGVQLEMALAPLYEGEETYDYFVNFFRDLGFVLWDIETGFRNKSTGQLLQADGIFVNPALVRS